MKNLTINVFKPGLLIKLFITVEIVINKQQETLITINGRFQK